MGEVGHEILRRKRPNGRDFKNMWRTRNKKPKESDESPEKSVEFVLRRVKDSDTVESSSPNHVGRTNEGDGCNVPSLEPECDRNPNHVSQTNEGDGCNVPSLEPECDRVNGADLENVFDMEISDKEVSEDCCNVVPSLEPDDSEKLSNKDVSGRDDKLAKSSKFVEYWVPVQLSNVQTEQYCSSLFSNEKLLCNESKHDLDNAKILEDLMISTRQCCDHPYLVDRELRTSLILGLPQTEQFEAEIKLSSKLDLLLKTLLEIKKRGLRALILYRPLGAGIVSIGDILDDIIHDNFGQDSYVRITVRAVPTLRKALLTEFNYIRSGKFVCLMETRACVPSVKLSSVDTVIFFNSDWDPMNDMRSLMKINLTSSFEQVKVFRLYSSHTIEEKVLILTKEGRTPESCVLNIKQSTCHRLLSWGVTKLFDTLDSLENTNSVAFSGDSLMEKVFTELGYLLPNNGISNDINTSSILRVESVRDVYPPNVKLFGERESSHMENFSLVEEMIDNEPPCVLWMNLLGGRQPTWKYLPTPASRTTRKTVYHLNDLYTVPLEEESASKECRKKATGLSDRVPLALRKKRNMSKKSSDGKKHNPIQKRSLSSLVNVQSKSDTSTREKTPMFETPSSAEPRLSPDRQSKSDTPTREQTPMLESPSSAEPRSSPERNGSLPSDQLRHHGDDPATIQNGQTSDQTEAPQPPHVSSAMSYVENGRETNLTTFPARLGYLPEAFQVPCSGAQPLQMELERLEMEKNIRSKLHQEKILQIKTRIQEVDQLRKMYDLQLQNSETAYIEEMKEFEAKSKKVLNNKELAEVISQVEKMEIYQLLSQDSGSPIVAPTSAEPLMDPGNAVARPAKNSTSHQLTSQDSGSPIVAPTSAEPLTDPGNAVARPAKNSTSHQSISHGSGSPITTSSSAESITGPEQALASPAKNLTPLMQPCQALLDHTSTPFSSMPAPIQPVNRFQGAYGVRATACAPHLRSSRPPMKPFTAPSGGITLLPGIAEQMISKVHTRQSPGFL